MLPKYNRGRWALATAMLTIALAAGPARAASGDLLVAPTRLVLDGARGSEVVLNNIGAEPATYRVSLELRRMTKDGKLIDVTEPNAAEKAALDMIAYAPRRVTLQPNQPQAIRVGVRLPEALADGEYRVHMLFRAIPDAKPAAPAQITRIDGVAIALTPIYGVTIPVIVRAGALDAKAGIANARIVDQGGKQAISFDISRTGTRSVFGEVRVTKPGAGDPVIVARGVAVYPEVDSRTVTLPVTSGFTGSLAGPATIRYVERAEDGGRVLAEADVVLR